MPKESKATFEEKLARLKDIKKIVEESPKPFGKIFAKLKQKYGLSQRMAQNYLRELCELGVLIYDEENGVYKPATVEKMSFNNRREYELALEHSKRLLFTQPDSEFQRYDLMSPWTVIDILAGLNQSALREEDQCFLEHLKWGYPEIYINLEKYRESAIKLGHSPLDMSPSFRGIFDLELNRGFQSQEERDKFYAENRREIEEFKNLREQLIGEIYNIMGAVKHGIPLKGHCKYCPHLHLTIKE